MRHNLIDLIVGITDVPSTNENAPCTSSLSYAQKTQLARIWLKTFQLKNIEFLRTLNYDTPSKFKNVTLITYSFPREESDYLQVEFAILHTWRMLGRMKTVVVADRHFPLLDDFAKKWSDCVTIQIQPTLICGDNRSISSDCLKNLHKRFSSDYCLTIQDDGFPIRDNLDDFIGHYDFIGAPVIRARIRILETIIKATNRTWLNGGFSLRTRMLCEIGARAYEHWNRDGRPFLQEDVFFTHTLHTFKKLSADLRFPTLQRAREFSATDIGGSIDIRARGYLPFGFHSPTTAIQFITEFAKLGYSIPDQNHIRFT